MALKVVSTQEYSLQTTATSIVPAGTQTQARRFIITGINNDSGTRQISVSVGANGFTPAKTNSPYGWQRNLNSGATYEIDDWLLGARELKASADANDQIQINVTILELTGG